MAMKAAWHAGWLHVVYQQGDITHVTKQASK